MRCFRQARSADRRGRSERNCQRVDGPVWPGDKRADVERWMGLRHRQFADLEPRDRRGSDKHAKTCPEQRNLLRERNRRPSPLPRVALRAHCAAKHLVTNFRLLQGMPLKCHSSKPGTRFCIREMAITWSPLTESNRRPSPYHGDALPTELRGPVFSYLTWAFMPRGGHSGRAQRSYNF